MALAKPTKYQQQKVKKYHRLIKGDAETPALYSVDKRVYRPKNKINLQKAQLFSNMPPGYDDLEVAFIPETGPGSRIRFSKSSMKIISKHIVREHRFFDTNWIDKAVKEARKFKKAQQIDGTMATVPMAERIDDSIFKTLVSQIEKVIRRDPPGLFYQIMCGEHFYGGEGGGRAMDRANLISHLKFLMLKYTATINKWLAGVSVYSFMQQNTETGFEGQYEFKQFQKYMATIDDKKIEKKIRKHKKKNNKLYADLRKSFNKIKKK